MQGPDLKWRATGYEPDEQSVPNCNREKKNPHSVE